MNDFAVVQDKNRQVEVHKSNEMLNFKISQCNDLIQVVRCFKDIVVVGIGEKTGQSIA
ncbi:hypothetical protein [Dyadobacter sandarakinus]|uniref:hypothetical protein n=1 Tax=Dyadobacter sandarakinus TaxID=2747268 RepID=UPI001E5CBAB3|nr:hypothetical protein [Dyadobacter sandarakinus]